MGTRLGSCAPLMAAAIVFAAGSAASASIGFRTVALTGTDGGYGPGLGSGVTFSLVDSTPAINSSGQVAFRGSTIASAFSPEGVWFRALPLVSGTNSAVAREGGAQPGGGTYAAGSGGYNTVQLNDAGDIAFRYTSNKGVFASQGGTMSRVALAGDVAPGTGDATYSTGPIASGMPLFNQSGVCAYVGALTVGTGTPPVAITSGNNNSSAIFIGTGDNSGGTNANVTPVVRGTDWFAGLGGTSTDTKLSAFSQSTLAFNNGGHYAVSSTLQGSAIVTGSSGNSVAIISNRSGTNDVIARAGSPAPDSTGAASADVYRSLGSGAIGFNNLGHVAYTSSLRQGATQTVASALFTDAGTGTLRRLAGSNDPVGPVYAISDNTTPLAEFAGLNYGASATFATTLLNHADQLLYTANMSSGGQAVLLRDANGDTHRVARVGDIGFSPDPLTTDGMGTSTLSGISNLSLNALGQVAFTANLSGPGVSVGLGNGASLWAVDTTGERILVARSGTTFVDALGNSHLIQSINFAGNTGNEDGRVSGFNNSGDLAFTLQFTDGTGGAFVTHIPSPGAMSLLGLGTLAALRRRRA